jgi:hypothetical protein
MYPANQLSLNRNGFINHTKAMQINEIRLKEIQVTEEIMFKIQRVIYCNNLLAIRTYSIATNREILSTMAVLMR